MFLRIPILLFLFCLPFSIVSAQENPRHIAADSRFEKVKTLSQNWSHQESNWFYNVPQGSRLIPYQWFINLEHGGAKEKFTGAKNIQRLGFIARKVSDDNPDALPVGFVKDAEFDDGSESLGLTCAACHTSQIIHNKIAYIVDGGPTLGDFEGLLRDLVTSMEETASDAVRFDRFAIGVLGDSAAKDEKEDLLEQLKAFTIERKEYNNRNLSNGGSPHFGYGRVDAFGAIFNEVSTKFLDLSDNDAPANAPVSYPCLWDTPQHERVQWNGAAKNRVNKKLGPILFGTKEIGALGRNSGEVLGVFGDVKVNKFKIPIRYKSTINKKNLKKIERSIKSLWSPEWPEAFGELDPDKIEAGENVYDLNCKRCHQKITRDARDRTVDLAISQVGTDSQVLKNFMRTAKTGKLEGRRVSIFGDEKFEDSALVGKILKHTVERSILELEFKEVVSLIKGIDIANLESLKPDYSNMVLLKVGEKEIPIPFEDIKSLELLIKQSGNKREVFKEALNKLKAKLVGAPDDPPPPGYKSRPLNGIWATAPYLHNGSVPNLHELLKAPDERVTSFHVGSQVYDTEKVGFVSDPDFPEFKTGKADAPVIGNSNLGHNFGSNLSAEDKAALLEYLKSL